MSFITKFTLGFSFRVLTSFFIRKVVIDLKQDVLMQFLVIGKSLDSFFEDWTYFLVNVSLYFNQSHTLIELFISRQDFVDGFSTVSFTIPGLLH